jgi:hypothetical protein
VSETLPESRAPMSQTFFGQSQFGSDVGQITATDILEFAAFEQIPDPLLWIQFRRVAR